VSAIQFSAVAAIMNLQAGMPGAGVDAAVSGSVAESKRYLYIVARSGKALAGDIFAAMRRDMASATVELIYDRRVGERRHESPSGIDQDRRASERRRLNAERQISSVGWTRIEVE
jgi:hypothetical protein